MKKNYKKGISIALLFSIIFISEINAQNNKYIAGNFTRFLQEFISLNTKNPSDNSLYLFEYGWRTKGNNMMGLKLNPFFSFKNSGSNGVKTFSIALSSQFYSYQMTTLTRKFDLSYGFIYPLGVSYTKSDNTRQSFSRYRFNLGIGYNLRPTYNLSEKIAVWTELGYSILFEFTQDKFGNSLDEPLEQNFTTRFSSPISIFIAYKF
jgi:hypothetical protein